MKIGRATFACLPGVPSEMKLMFREQVVPRLRQEGFVERVIVHRKINLFGKGEAEIEAQALDLTARGRVPEVGITAHDATISFRISAAAATEDEARNLIEPTAQLIYERFGSLDRWARARRRTRSAVRRARAHRRDPGHGRIMHRRFDRAHDHGATRRQSVLSGRRRELCERGQDSSCSVFPESLIEAHGAVSPEVAAAMAEGVRKRFGADLGLSTTGVAGPAGGTPEKPVGLVYLGLSTSEGTQTRRIDIGADQPRAIIQHRASKAALNWVRLTLAAERLNCERSAMAVRAPARAIDSDPPVSRFR